jgi:predicted RNA binding protein YcfA (HicA-like mRNA interferase family)
VRDHIIPIRRQKTDGETVRESAKIQGMNKLEKLHQRILEGKADANISFEDLRSLLVALGFVERIKGSHHTYRRADIAEKPNLQRDGNKAKSYQVRQIRQILRKYDL